VPHHVLDGDHIELRNSEAAEDMAQVVKRRTLAPAFFCARARTKRALIALRSSAWPSGRQKTRSSRLRKCSRLRIARNCASAWSASGTDRARRDLVLV